MIGPWEIFMILIVVLLLFGAGRLPTIMGDVAKGIKTFKSGLKDEDVAQKEAEKKRITHAAEHKVSEVEKSKEL
jgi:sec-independent protein translocase protein TatA